MKPVYLFHNKLSPETNLTFFLVRKQLETLLFLVVP